MPSVSPRPASTIIASFASTEMRRLPLSRLASGRQGRKNQQQAEQQATQQRQQAAQQQQAAWQQQVDLFTARRSSLATR
jgi:hypothetical protein